MGKLSQWRDRYVMWHAGTFPVPIFEDRVIVRERILFDGRVQKVGFRLEIETLANRLSLAGFAQNVTSGQVLAEVQGTEQQIDYLIMCMCSLKRASVTYVERKRIAVIDEEHTFFSKF